MFNIDNFTKPIEEKFGILLKVEEIIGKEVFMNISSLQYEDEIPLKQFIELDEMLENNTELEDYHISTYNYQLYIDTKEEIE